MTPQEYADKLVERFGDKMPVIVHWKEIAVNCAIICTNEIISTLVHYQSDQKQFYQQVLTILKEKV